MMIDLLNWGLRTGVVISGLIGLVLLLRRPFARYFGAEATFILWSLPLIRLCLPDMHMRVKTEGLILPYDWFPIWDGNEGEGAISSSVVLSVPDKVLQAPQAFLAADMIITTLIVLWLSIGFMWFGFHGLKHIRYGRLLRHVSVDYPATLEPNIQRALNLVDLRKAPDIKIAPKNIGPLVSGLFNPVIILPKDFEHHYSKDAQLFSLVHELSHIKRRDLWSVFAALLFRAIHWYNPLVHYAARKFKIDLEAACDAHALAKFAGDDQATHNYALTLLLAEQQGVVPSKMPSLSLALHENYEGEIA